MEWHKNNVKKNCMIRPKNFTNNFLAESSHKFKARGKKKIFLFLWPNHWNFQQAESIHFFNRPNSISSKDHSAYSSKFFLPNRTVFVSAYCNIFVVLSEKPQFYFVLRINVWFMCYEFRIQWNTKGSDANVTGILVTY